MTVQSEVKQYQDKSGLGVLEENQPNTIGSFISANQPDQQQQMGFGVFVVRKNAAHPKRVAAISAGTPKILGATIKSQDVVDNFFGNIYPAQTKNSEIPAFNYAEGQKVPVALQGYVSMITPSTDFDYDEDVYVKVAVGTGTDDGFPLGAVNNVKGAATTGDYQKLPNAVFASKYQEGQVKIARIYFDCRLLTGSTTIAN